MLASLVLLRNPELHDAVYVAHHPTNNPPREMSRRLLVKRRGGEPAERHVRVVALVAGRRSHRLTRVAVLANSSAPRRSRRVVAIGRRTRKPADRCDEHVTPPAVTLTARVAVRPLPFVERPRRVMSASGRDEAPPNGHSRTTGEGTGGTDGGEEPTSRRRHDTVDTDRT